MEFNFLTINLVFKTIILFLTKSKNYLRQNKVVESLIYR